MPRRRSSTCSPSAAAPRCSSPTSTHRRPREGRSTSGTTTRARSWPGCTPTPSSSRCSEGRRPPRTASARIWLQRLEADLDVIEGYVGRDLHAYLAEEVDALGLLIDTLDAPVHAAVHGDPWHENVLVAPDRLWLLDWEDLSVGDPVVDDAILLHDALGTDPHHWPDTAAYAVARRALMLDAVVDVAADWVENTNPLVRRRKEAAYLAELEAYLAESWSSA